MGAEVAINAGFGTGGTLGTCFKSGVLPLYVIRLQVYDRGVQFRQFRLPQDVYREHPTSGRDGGCRSRLGGGRRRGRRPASATVHRNTIGVASCVNQPTAPQVQVTTPTVVVFTTTGLLRLRFTANADHCSDMIATPVVDGRRLRGVRLGPGETTPWYFARKLTDGKVTLERSASVCRPRVYRAGATAAGCSHGVAR